MEIKGIIKGGERKNITRCCDYIDDIIIGDTSLFDALEKLFDQDVKKYRHASFSHHPKQSPQYGVRYVILEEAPMEEKSFNDLCAEVQINTMYADYYRGCYSEYTCGWGGFDYVLGKEGEGHSVFEELKSHIGKYIHFQI